MVQQSAQETHYAKARIQLSQLYRAITRAVCTAAGIVVLLWFLDQAPGMLLLAFFALVIGLVLNVPVTWLEQRKVPRWAAEQWFHEMAALFRNSPEVAEKLRFTASDLSDSIPSTPTLLGRVGKCSRSLPGAAALYVVFLAMAIYILANPSPLVVMYLHLWPDHMRSDAVRALVNFSRMVGGWMYSNVLVGGMESAAVAIVLSLRDVPGVMIWSVLAFFAELVPKLGPYLMGFPPLLVALSTDRKTAAWVLIFYLALNQERDLTSGGET